MFIYSNTEEQALQGNKSLNPTDTSNLGKVPAFVLSFGLIAFNLKLAGLEICITLILTSFIAKIRKSLLNRRKLHLNDNKHKETAQTYH